MLGGRENVLQRIAGRRMKYFGHVERIPDFMTYLENEMAYLGVINVYMRKISLR